MVIRLIFFTFILIGSVYAAEQKKFLIVTEPVADIRQKPVDAAVGYQHDDLQETQVLYNEVLLYKGENADWYEIEAVEQQEFSHNQKWQGYPGWIKKKNVKSITDVGETDSVVKNKTANVYSSAAVTQEILLVVLMGTRFKIIAQQGRYYGVYLPDNRTGWVKKEDLFKSDTKLSQAQLRENIFSTAKLFLGASYLWGGRSIPALRLDNLATGVDCSGLTSLVYRANGVDIPRDAHEQWLAAEKISSRALNTADLIFVSSKDNLEKIVHVMMYMDGEYFIESAGTGNAVGIKTFREKFGINLSELVKRDFVIDGKKIYFGRILK